MMEIRNGEGASDAMVVKVVQRYVQLMIAEG